MKKLPEFYVVECNNKEQTNEVCSYVNNEETTFYNHWKYVTNSEFSDSSRINDDINGKAVGLPIIQFNDWKKLTSPEPKKRTLQEKADRLAVKYLTAFAKQTNTEPSFMFDYDLFAGIEAADMYLDFTTVKYMVDNEVPFDTLYAWYWTTLDLAMLGLETVSLSYWIKNEANA